MSAHFQVDEVFSVSGRGTVLQGMVLDGAINSGMRVTVPGAQNDRRVVAVERIHGSRIPVGSVGLVLDPAGTEGEDVQELRALAKGKVLDIS